MMKEMEIQLFSSRMEFQVGKKIKNKRKERTMFLHRKSYQGLSFILPTVVLVLSGSFERCCVSFIG